MPRIKLSVLPLERLQAEIQRRMKELPKLIKQRDELNRRIAEMGVADVQAEGKVARGRPKAAKAAKAGRRRRPKARNKVSLVDSLAAALKVKGSLSVGEAVDAVKAAGYKSNSRIFRTIVNQTLAKVKRFKKVGRGQYALAD